MLVVVLASGCAITTGSQRTRDTTYLVVGVAIAVGLVVGAFTDHAAQQAPQPPMPRPDF